MSTAPQPNPLAYLMPGWFSIVMGLAGLALAWHQAARRMGPVAEGVSMALGAFAGLVFAALLVLSLWRWHRHPQAVREDLHHPVRHAFWAAVPISLLLLVTAWVAHRGPSTVALVLWALGSAAQLGVTLWVITRWWRGHLPGGLVWAGITPALFIPIVGNVLVPLAGVPLGQAHWSAAQFGIGLIFWPVVLVLIMVRKATAGLWPERLMPTAFIHTAPPAVMGLALMQMGAPVLIGWGAWGMALVFAWWAGTQWRRIVALPFGVTHWALSFPLAAFTALTWTLADTPLVQVLAVALLAVVSLVVLGLLRGTWQGLRRGTLLVAEGPAAAGPPTPPPGKATPTEGQSP
ncbi:MAG: SLAC1 anion channel family protein [Caldimonas sp.]|uniref:SLAC1 anion channel family protein n=1 Tax=Caldimonas sp. TaxID=2838790 RepID=UPI00391B9054